MQTIGVANYTDRYREICGTVWTSPHPRRVVDEISYGIGCRPPGSEALRQAREYLSQEFASIGLVNIHEQDVPVLAWDKGHANLELVSPYHVAFDTVHCVHTEAGQGVAPVVDSGAAGEAEVGRFKSCLKGALALIVPSASGTPSYEPLLRRITRLAEHGAAGAIVQNINPTLGPSIELVGLDRVAPIPVLGISYEQGQELRWHVRRGKAEVRYRANGKSNAAVCANLIGELQPDQPCDEIVINSSHLDSQLQAPGSFDDLSGVAAMLEVARALAPYRHDFKRTLRFIAYTAEEFGFIGSKTYVQQIREQLDAIRFVVNFDELTAETAKGAAVMWSEPMCDFVADVFRATARSVEARNFFCFSSDYVPYMLVGIPAARPADFLLRTHPAVSHTRYDTPDKVPCDWIRLNAMNFAQLLYAIAVHPGLLPAHLNSPEEVSELIDREGIRQVVDSMDLASLLDGNT